MKIKHQKTIAKLLVECNYATYWKSTNGHNDETIGYWVYWWTPPENAQLNNDVREFVEPFDDTFDGMQQAIALENYLVWNEKELWADSNHCPISTGQYCVYKRRLNRIKHCVKAITKRS